MLYVPPSSSPYSGLYGYEYKIRHLSSCNFLPPLLSFHFLLSNDFTTALTLSAVDFWVSHSYERRNVLQSHIRLGEISRTCEHLNRVCTAYTSIMGYNYTGSSYKNTNVIKSKCSWPCFSIAVFHRLQHRKSTSSSDICINMVL